MLRRKLANAPPPLLFVEARDTPVLHLRASPLRGAERRETRRLARPPERLAKPPDTLARRVAPACDRGSAPLGALLAASSSAGRAFGRHHVAHRPSASSWRGVL